MPIEFPVVNGIIVAAELVLADSRWLRVPIREDIDVLRNAFDQQPYIAGDHLIVIADGRIYRNVLVVIYVNEDGSKVNACTGEKVV